MIYQQQGEETGKAVIRPEVKHAGRNIFWVFQGKGYQAELMKGYLWAPMMDKSGNSPAHWTMLENVKEGDIIFHGVAGGILAISVAYSALYFFCLFPFFAIKICTPKVCSTFGVYIIISSYFFIITYLFLKQSSFTKNEPNK